ncbi:MAG: hypothetical protein GX160_08245 [Clostridiales bacterium]|nr:hypothetical protein [Clostridiales bacterium]
MRWRAVLKDLKDDKGIICPQHSNESIVIPIEYLPKGCRVGDVLQFNISFDPFSTIMMIKESGSKDT